MISYLVIGSIRDMNSSPEGLKIYKYFKIEGISLENISELLNHKATLNEKIYSPFWETLKEKYMKYYDANCALLFAAIVSEDILEKIIKSDFVWSFDSTCYLFDNVDAKNIAFIKTPHSSEVHDNILWILSEHYE